MYPPLHVGSFVRKYKKGDNVGTKKGWIPKWSDKIYEIAKIEEGLYYLKDDPVKRGILRHDLLRVDESQEIPDEVEAKNIEKLNKAEPRPTRRLTAKTRVFQIT